jgi:hypothetical protein
MKLSNLHMRKNDGLTRAVASVAFEDSDQPAQEIFIETETAYAESISLPTPTPLPWAASSRPFTSGNGGWLSTKPSAPAQRGTGDGHGPHASLD